MKYQSNPTMRLLGKQYYNTMLTQETFNQLKDIVKAYIEDKEPLLNENALMDAFVLGFINGKRAERGRRMTRKTPAKTE